LCAALLFAAVTSPAQTVIFTEFAVPTQGAGPYGVAAGPDGAIWFTESNFSNNIGRITTAGAITNYFIPTFRSQPTGIVAGPDHALWFTEASGNKIGRITTAGVLTNEYAVPTPAGSPTSITVGPDGALWFVEADIPTLGGNGNGKISIGRITTAGVIAEYPVPTAQDQPIGAAGPSGIVVGPDGALWFTEFYGNNIGRITMAGMITEYPLPTAFAGPSGIAAGPDGALWFTEDSSNKIGRITTSGVITEYAVPQPLLGTPYLSGITAGPDGALWFTDAGGVGNIGRITTAGVIKEFAPPSDGSQPSGITTGPDGALWFAESRTNIIGRAALSLSPGEPLISAVVPVGSTVNIIQSGEWVSIYGMNLASSTVTWDGNFPTSLGGTSVTIDGESAYLSFVSPTQINVQVAEDAATGLVPVVVTTTAGKASSTVTLAPFAPSFLLLDSKHVAGIIPRSDGTGAYAGGSYDILGPAGNSLGYATVAAKAGDTVELFALGLGPTDPAGQPGHPFSGVAPTTNPVKLLINNVSVTPSFSGLSGAGLYQINLTVPAGLGMGDVPLAAKAGGAQTQAGVMISLQ
jgi:virginiamycin B lyase